MKLPDEVGKELYVAKSAFATYEAIVRDCAKVITDQIPNWCAPGQAMLLELVAKDILRRYDLEERK